MSYLISIFCFALWWYDKSTGNVLESGMALIAAGLFWFAGNYAYTDKINLNKEKEKEENVEREND